MALLIVLLSGQAWAWWDDAWPYRMKIQVDSARITDPLSQVAVAVRLHNGNFPFSGCKPDGSDLRFVATDETTLLPFHLDKFDSISGIAVVWVQLPTLGSEDAPDHFWLYYGNDQAVSVQDAARTYDPHQSLVLHFGEQETNPRDSSGHTQPTRATELVVTPAGVLHAAARFSGASAIKLPASDATRQSANRGLSFSTWIKPDGVQPNAVLFEQRDGALALVIGVASGKVYARIERGSGKAVETPRAELTPGKWQHLGLIAADRLTLYLNGQEVASVTARLDDLGGDIHLGNDATGQRGFIGEMDETGLASVARPAAWMQVASALGPDGNLLVYGEEENEEAADGAYLGIVKILVNSVSPEGWVVIGLIGLLGLVSLEAGVNKSIYLGRTEQANRVFQSRLKGLPVGVSGTVDAPLAKGEPSDDIRHASLLRLYRHAMEELGRILDLHEQSGYGKHLSPQGMEALRFSLDVVMVDEVQRLNHKLVLLTLAVSGAPFLGLLGTVVGIMITFATIAATGDVNVNTIAPGVAAALTTTVAGLMVAIPVMFAYNHLTLRITNMTSAMEVFADELVGQLALAHALKGREHASPHPGK
ncbi:MAG: DUF2341 domain-containing protein [Pseudomonadota bacterium]